MSYHVLPIDDIYQHDKSSTCKCEPRLEMNNEEMIFVHNPWDKREYIEKAIDAVNENVGTNESIGYFTEYCIEVSKLACEGLQTWEWVKERIGSGYAHLYAAWRKQDIEIIFE